MLLCVVYIKHPSVLVCSPLLAVSFSRMLRLELSQICFLDCSREMFFHEEKQDACRHYVLQM